MRYCLAKNDYIRTQIISKKINTKFFEDESTQDLKIIFYDRMIEMDQHDGAYLSICRHLRAKLDTPSVDAATKKKLHREAVLYLILSPFDNEQSDLLHRMLEDKALEDIPTYRALLELFKNQELINWRELVARYEKELKAGSGAESPPTGVFDESALGVKRWQHLKDRVVEHNIRIMAKYYTKVTLTRMAQLLDLKTDEVEEVLCNMVVAGTVRGKTDRPAGIVSFQESKDPSELLNDWSHNLNSLMSLIARTTHLINKEEMVHKHLFVQNGEIGASQPPSDQNVAVPMEVEGN
jgi:26S proteasome regulatory subunit N5